MEIKDFNNINFTASYYGGQAGKKQAFINENNEIWFLKFPKSTSQFENVERSYTNSSISEYIGSKIFEIMGYDVHEVELGIFKDKLVVACKDFTEENREYRFYEMNKVINKYTDDVEFTKLGIENVSFYVILEEVLYNLDKNSDMKKVENIKERFYDMFVIDAFINNNDRHNGNWGIMTDRKEYKLAPIYDNGNSFFPKHSLDKIKEILNNENKFNSVLLNGNTPFKYKDKNVDSIRVIKKLSLNLEDKSAEALEFGKQLKEAVKRVVPKINLKAIKEVINEIPEKYNGLEIMPKEMKKFYIKLLEQRYEKILLPSYEKIINNLEKVDSKNKNKKKEYER